MEDSTKKPSLGVPGPPTRISEPKAPGSRGRGTQSKGASLTV